MLKITIAPFFPRDPRLICSRNHGHTHGPIFKLDTNCNRTDEKYAARPGTGRMLYRLATRPLTGTHNSPSTRHVTCELKYRLFSWFLNNLLVKLTFVFNIFHATQFYELKYELSSSNIFIFDVFHMTGFYGLWLWKKFHNWLHNPIEQCMLFNVFRGLRGQVVREPDSKLLSPSPLRFESQLVPSNFHESKSPDILAEGWWFYPDAWLIVPLQTHGSLGSSSTLNL